jgi:predicted GNAT superfamily acetyltransferase
VSDHLDAEVDAAVAVAAAAAGHAGVALRGVHTHADMVTVSRLVDEVWGRPEGAGPIVATELLVAMAHAGTQVTLAERDGRPIGATVALVGLDPQQRPWLHSHVTGVVAGAEGRGVGQALKWHQRAWALAHGIDRVRWTYDPLIRRNAVLNLVRLGARVVRYDHDVYGRMDDARNAGLPTDRILVEWELTGARTRAAAAGRPAEPDLEALRRAGARPRLTVDDQGRPHLTPADVPRRLVQVPADIEAVRRTDRDLAAAWAAAVRTCLGDRLDAGDRVSGMTRDGWYVLSADRGVQELAGARP